MNLDKLDNIISELETKLGINKPEKVLRKIKMSPQLKKRWIEFNAKVEELRLEAIKFAEKIEKTLKDGKELSHESRTEVELNEFHNELEVDRETFEIKVLDKK